MSPLDDRKGVWKSGRGKGRKTPKGRQLDDGALAEVQALLGDRPRRRDLLIEHLQTEQGELSESSRLFGLEINSRLLGLCYFVLVFARFARCGIGLVSNLFAVSGRCTGGVQGE